ncbi:MAG: alpha/beta fold hydrolase [Gaiellales bacterium]
MATRDGVRIYYEAAGRGPALVLHAGAAGDLRMWQRAGYADALSAGHRVILIDHRGQGLSDRPPGLEAHRLSQYTADVQAVLDREEIDRCIFWGHADGGRVGIELAAGMPDRVLALIASGVVDEPPDVRRRAAAGFRSIGMGELLRLIQRDEGIEAPGWLWLQFLETDVEMMCLELEAWADSPGPWEASRAIRCPVLFLSGELEDPAGELAALAARMPDATAATIRGRGHVGAFLEAEPALAHARPFLQRVSPR